MRDIYLSFIDFAARRIKTVGPFCAVRVGKYVVNGYRDGECVLVATPEGGRWQVAGEWFDSFDVVTDPREASP